MQPNVREGKRESLGETQAEKQHKPQKEAKEVVKVEEVCQ